MRKKGSCRCKWEEMVELCGEESADKAENLVGMKLEL